MFVSDECCMLIRGFGDGPITRQEESVCVCVGGGERSDTIITSAPMMNK